MKRAIVFLILAVLITPVAYADYVSTVSDSEFKQIITHLKYEKFAEVAREVAPTLVSSSKYPLTDPELEELLYYEVEKLEGDIYNLSAEIVIQNFKHRYAQKVIIARGDIINDAMAIAPYAKKEDIPILLAKPDGIPNATLEAIEKLHPREIIIVGGEKAIGKKVENRLENFGKITRIYGEDRYSTSVEVAKLFKKPERIVITDGRSPSLKALVMAAYYRCPLVYVHCDIPGEVEKYLHDNRLTKDFRPTEIFLVETKPELTDKVRDIVKSYAWGGKLKLYVENVDDDDLYVDAFIDKMMKAELVRENATKFFGTFNLSVGNHTIKLRWFDPTTNEFYEKYHNITLSPGETISITLQTERHEW